MNLALLSSLPWEILAIVTTRRTDRSGNWLFFSDRVMRVLTEASEDIDKPQDIFQNA